LTEPAVSLSRSAGFDPAPGTRPADWLGEAVARFGEPDVALRCAAVLRGGHDPELLPYLGRSTSVLVGASSADYYPRAWAARGLRYAWDDRAGPAVVDALDDAAWRVREMAAKVVAVREIGEAGDALAALATDPVPRVRAAVAAALGQVGEIEHVEALYALAQDAEPTVRGRAERALRAMSARLDRSL
jgi:HEAT repeat protein